VTDLRVGMLEQVEFERLPRPIRLVANLLAGGTHRQESAQLPHVSEGFFGHGQRAALSFLMGFEAAEEQGHGREDGSLDSGIHDQHRGPVARRLEALAGKAITCHRGSRWIASSARVCVLVMISSVHPNEDSRAAGMGVINEEHRALPIDLREREIDSISLELGVILKRRQFAQIPEPSTLHESKHCEWYVDMHEMMRPRVEDQRAQCVRGS